MKYKDIREEELKNKVAQDYFGKYDCAAIIGNIDFCVKLKTKEVSLFEAESLFWAEAKKDKSDIYKSITQLILTIGKAKTFNKSLPPAFLGAFDGEKIAFISYNDIQEIFYINDFNWNVTPSNYDTKEFAFVLAKVTSTIQSNSLLFDFIKDDKELKEFIKINFIIGKSEASKIKIDKNNFVVIYNKWLKVVKPTIAIDWSIAKKHNIIDGDFYLADLLSKDNVSLKDKLYVLLKNNEYKLDRKLNDFGTETLSTTSFSDNQKAHNEFWNRFDRPPKEEYWDYIVDRRDLLVPQDVRERKGSYFTPKIWVELSQKYLTDVLGEDWQDEYYIWDCAAGTGNLLNGLTNKYNIWASTLDKQDVDVMKDRIVNGANLLESHVFQFDFLNDDFSKLPAELQKIIYDEEKRKKLVIYINPPYAEHGNRTTIVNHGIHKSNVANASKTYNAFSSLVGTAARELFAQFFLRTYHDIPNCKLATFSTLKYVNSQNFIKFRQLFKADCLASFLVPADTFDNVKGKFPICFSIWDLSNQAEISHMEVDIFNSSCIYIGRKSFFAFNGGFISSWLRLYYDKQNANCIGYIILPGIDMQQQNGVYFTSQPTTSDIKQHKTAIISKNNLKEMCIYFSVRHCIEANWLNDRDQFLYPNNLWETDFEFQNDCLAFTLFNSQNRISCKNGVNNWIPFTENEVNAKEKFDSNFMTDFIKGKLKQKDDLFNTDTKNKALEFSKEAKDVFSAGLQLWKYYHSKENINVNASLYDIKEYFQGRNGTGKMNSKSEDAHYMSLLENLKISLKLLAKKIEPKVYEYGFLNK